MQRSMGDLLKSVNLVKVGLGLLSGAAIGLAVKGFFSMVSSMTEADDVLAKISKRLGISVTKLSELRVAANLSGVSTGVLTKALQNMISKVSEAATGTGEAKDAIEERGLSAEELNNMKPDEALGAIAEALEGIENQADKVRIAEKLFGARGAGLLVLLDKGKKGLDDMAEAARKTGNVLSESAAKDAEDYNDAILLLTETWEGFKRQVVNAILPDLVAGIQNVTEWFQNMMAETDGDPLASFRVSLIKTSIDILTTARNVAIFITAMAALLTLLGLAPAALAAITAGAIAIGANEAINALEAKLADARQEESTRLRFEEEGRRVHEEASGMSDDDTRGQRSTTNTSNTNNVSVTAVVDEDKKVVSFKSESEIQTWAENELVQGLQHLDRRGL